MFALTLVGQFKDRMISLKNSETEVVQGLPQAENEKQQHRDVLGICMYNFATSMN